ncbi:MAG: lytic murein transglycosylase [Caulobacteraceae bacterium]
MKRRDFLAGTAGVLAATGLAARPARAQLDALTQAQFDDWLAGVRPQALQAGLTADGWDAALQGLSPDPVVIARKAAAAETNRTVADYVQGLLNGRGQRARAKYAALPALAQIEDRFGVPGGVLVAFWGMESDYGANIGDRDVLRAVATHGAAGSGGADWTAEFIAAARVLQSGVVAAPGLIGSYAGAMGQTQLMPTKYLLYGVDFDGDGRIDVWKTPVDALASAAQHLTKAVGWNRGQGWLDEVTLPPGFDLSRAEVEVTSLPIDQWASMGVRRADGAPWTGGLDPGRPDAAGGRRGPCVPRAAQLSRVRGL